MTRPQLALTLAAVIVAMGFACGDDGDGDVADRPSTTVSADASAAGRASPAATGSDDPALDVRGSPSVAMAMENFAFSPALLRGTPGQVLTIALTNESGAPHTFTIENQSIDVNVASGARAEVEVRFPESGGLAFVCAFHAASGMRGELLAGDGAPAVAGTVPASGGYAY